MSLGNNKRTHYFINREFQTKFILEFCSLAAVGAVILGIVLVLYVWSQGTVTTAFIDSRLKILTTSDYLMPIILGVGAITLLFVCAITGVFAVYLSHRIVGPLFRIERSAIKIGEGDLQVKINLRSTDEIKRTAEYLNNMTESLKIHVLDIKTKWESLAERLKDLSEKSGKEAGISREIKNIVQDLAEEKKEMDRAVSYFKLG